MRLNGRESPPPSRRRELAFRNCYVTTHHPRFLRKTSAWVRCEDDESPRTTALDDAFYKRVDIFLRSAFSHGTLSLLLSLLLRDGSRTQAIKAATEWAGVSLGCQTAVHSAVCYWWHCCSPLPGAKCGLKKRRLWTLRQRIICYGYLLL